MNDSTPPSLSEQNPQGAQNATNLNPQYEAPRVESVLTPDDMEREVLYAGIIVTPDGNAN